MQKTLFNSCNFDSSARFMGAKFKGESDFTLAKFNTSAIFNGTLFDKVVRFLYCEFGTCVNSGEGKKVKASFYEVTCARGAQFYGSNFYCNANFKYFACNLKIDFRNAKFIKLANFNHARFINSCEVDLSRAVFNNISCVDVSFRGNFKSIRTQYKNIAAFVGCGFWMMADFSDATFLKTAYFFRTSFGATTVFDQTTFKKRLIFNKSRFSDKVFFLASRVSW